MSWEARGIMGGKVVTRTIALQRITTQALIPTTQFGCGSLVSLLHDVDVAHAKAQIWRVAI